MTHEYEEMQQEISKVHEQVHQISLSQRAAKNEMDGLKKGVEAKMNGLEAKMDGMEVGRWMTWKRRLMKKWKT